MIVALPLVLPAAVIAALSWMVRIAIISVIVKLVVLLGVGVVAYFGMDALTDWIGDTIKSSIVGLPPEITGLLGLAGVDVGISMIVSAIAVRLTLRALSGGPIYRFAMGVAS